MKQPILRRKWFLRFQEGDKTQWGVWKWVVYKWDNYTDKMLPTYFDTEAPARRFFET